MELTPAQVVNTLSDISKSIERQAVEVENLDRLFVEAKALYRREFAKAFLDAEGSNDVRRFQADLATAELLLDMEVKEQVLRAGKESLRVLRDRLEVGRSLNTIMRLEWSSDRS